MLDLFKPVHRIVDASSAAFFAAFADDRSVYSDALDTNTMLADASVHVGRKRLTGGGGKTDNLWAFYAHRMFGKRLWDVSSCNSSFSLTSYIGDSRILSSGPLM
jgi:hypothetical protein